MSLEFKKISSLNPGMLNKLLKEAYAFDKRFEEVCGENWLEFDTFFFENLMIADQCGFATVLDNEVIGFISWDPRNKPNYIEIGHNCIQPKYRGNGYGKTQLQEALRRIYIQDVEKIIVSTNQSLIPAQRMYESVGFEMTKLTKSSNNTDFSGLTIHYILKNKSQ